MFSKNVDKNSKLVYIGLKKFINNITGSCFPSKKLLCEMCNISMSTLDKAMKNLIDAGVLKKQYRYRRNFSQTSNMYTITPFMISGDYYFNVRADILDLGLSVKEVMVYSYLCSVADKDHNCYPSIKTISEQCELSVSTIKIALRLLVSKKLIAKENQFRLDGGKRNNTYTIIQEEVESEQVEELEQLEQLEQLILQDENQQEILEEVPHPELQLDENIETDLPSEKLSENKQIN
ncbi:helix-turn-helix domain-containing protein [Sedimentibacter sp. zth1]|uniref:helix-turn-helix domain-containing protein n=1 Tax=Sedimentibacter sp. zth1 TaxID=2816908 RepID=UPI001A9324CB|nr:helix-turn-helix domain-containing protein [Sedimentibacter sp. zth1]QSX05898.1 helix-turn-helix domain-containing protein [Sedimentibacter sp. zth1]